MSLQTFVQTVEADIEAGVKWVEGETETALTDIWNVVKPVFIAFEPTVVSQAMTAIGAWLATVEQDLASNELPDLEQQFLQWLEVNKNTLLADVTNLGSLVLQALIGLVRAA